MTDDIGEITKCYTVTFKRRSKHDAARMWRAITEPDEIASWMGGAAKVDLRAGGEYSIDFHGDGKDVMGGIIVRVDDGTKLGYVWGWSYVEWVLEDTEDGCSYTFVQNGLADRGEDADEEGLAAGWHEFFDRLDDHLDGVSRSNAEHEQRWQELKPPYRKMLDEVIR